MKSVQSFKAKAVSAKAPIARTSDEFAAIMLLPRNVRQSRLRDYYNKQKNGVDRN